MIIPGIEIIALHSFRMQLWALDRVQDVYDKYGGEASSNFNSYKERLYNYGIGRYNERYKKMSIQNIYDSIIVERNIKKSSDAIILREYKHDVRRLKNNRKHIENFLIAKSLKRK